MVALPTHDPMSVDARGPAHNASLLHVFQDLRGDEPGLRHRELWRDAGTDLGAHAGEPIKERG